MRVILTLIVVGFVVFCGWLVVESGLFECSLPNSGPCILLQRTTDDKNNSDANVPVEEPSQIGADKSVTFGADSASAKSVTLGSVDPKSGFNFQLELSSKGAAIKKATFSGFDDRDYKDPQPLVILSPVRQADGSEILSMANKGFQTDALFQQNRELRLDKFIWKSFDKVIEDDSQTVRFEAVFKPEDANDQVFKLTKTYTIIRSSYLLNCDITVENLSSVKREVRFNLAGPAGIGREGVRADMRKAVAGFIDSEQEVYTKRLDVRRLKKPKLEYAKAYLDNLDPYKRWWRFWEMPGARKAKAPQIMRDAKREIETMGLSSRTAGGNPIWMATANKYFAAILRPVPDAGKNQPDWLAGNHVEYHDPDLNMTEEISVNQIEEALKDEPDGDETVFAFLKISPTTLASMGQSNSTKTYNFQLYLGPKDNRLFHKNELYRELGFVQTIDFMVCCCPAGIIKPLAFGILAIMKWMYGFIGNYGVVIIILVFLMRLAMHPITKKSQVSMSKMSKLAPKAEEIKKKYANNKVEMNKQVMALYKEQGASPIMGFLPMMVQMPIWIALWSAIYASIELRGASFLPFWITDLSVPDALFRFPTAIIIPLLGWKIESLNLLPLMMGLAFYLQQKLMPSQAAASANPQVAQQQKMMMIMMPLLFPLMLYKAPSGVNLYIMASTFAGVFEQYVIRKHIREKEEAESQGLVAATSKTGGKVKKKKPKPFYRT